MADLNLANKNIKDLKAKLEQKELEVYLLRENLAAISNNKENEKIISQLNNQIKEYEQAIEHLNKKVDYLLEENNNLNELLKLKDQKIQEYENTLEDNNIKIKDVEENLKINLLSNKEHVDNSKKLNEKIQEMENLKENLIIELENKNQIVYLLQQDNLTLKKDNKDLIDFKEEALVKLNDFESNLNQEKYKNDKESEEPTSPSRLRYDDNTFRKLSSENFGLMENLKDDLQTSYNKSLKKIDKLNREIEKLNIQLSAIKDEHKIENMRLNLTIEELLKITNNSYNAIDNDSEVGEGGKVSSIVKNIQSKVNENTIEELKKEKISYLETIEKLKMRIEALENTNNMDNISINYQQTETFVNNFTPQKDIQSSNNLNDENTNKDLKNLNSIINNNNNNDFNTKEDNEITNNKNNNSQNQHVSFLEGDVINNNELLEKNQNEIRERERKIEYLLQILEDKNNLIEKLRDSDRVNSSNQSADAKETLEYLQFQNENLLKEIEDKNAKLKKLNKDYNDQIAKFELLQADFLELQEKENEITIYTDEIELLKNKNKEYESLIEKMNKEINVKSNTLLRKEKEVNSLKADRANNTNNKSLLDNTINKSALLDINANNVTNNSIIKDPKIEYLNNSLNEIRDLKEKLKQNNLNRSMRSRKGNSYDSVLNNNSLLNSNNSIIINETNQNIPRVVFEEDPNSNNQKKPNNINNSTNNINNSIAVDANNFNIGNVSNINLNDTTAINNNDNNNNLDAKDKNYNAVNQQALFVSEYSSNNNPYYNQSSYYTTNNAPNNLANLENFNTNSDSKFNFDSNAFYSNNSYMQKDYIIPNYTSNTEVKETLKTNDLNTNITNFATKDFANSNIHVFESIQINDILQSQENWDQLRNWVANSLQKEKNKFSFNKIFKATEDGFISSSFYAKAESKSPTLIIMKNNFGKIIGGFTSIAWKTPLNSIDFLEDPNKSGFLFSINIGKKYDLKENAIAVCHSIGCGPVFGLNDLEIVENANKNYNYFSNIGTSYNFDDAMEDFYGEAKFLVEDYEAYEVVFA